MNSAQTYDFRNTRWGMSKKEVLDSEADRSVVQTDDQVGYFTEILDKNIYLAYIFTDDQLVSALYALRDIRENLDDSFKDFEDFKKILTMKYGKPNAGHGDVWNDPSYEDDTRMEAILSDRSKYEEALKNGEIVHAALWKTENTWITVALSKMTEKNTCGATVEYKSIRHLRKL